MMKNELKYTLNAGLLALFFFGAIGIIGFILVADQPVKQQPVNNIDWAMGQLQKASNDPKFDKGKQLFTSSCAGCHPLNRHIDGPTLADIETRVPDIKLLYEWIRNSENVLKSGNKYFNDLYNSYNKTAMSSFPNLTDEEIDAILFYIKIQSTLLRLPIAPAK